MSGDSDQEYFSDGIADDIITELSRVRWLFVIARNSSFAYKGNAIDVKQIGRELGVRYVLEGSVRRGGERVRVNAQLIDAETGSHVWADRYDRVLTDVFAVQDEITLRSPGRCFRRFPTRNNGGHCAKARKSWRVGGLSAGTVAFGATQCERHQTSTRVLPPIHRNGCRVCSSILSAGSHLTC